MDDERNLERELRRALRRVPAPEGFPERVLARAGQERSVRRTGAGLAAPAWRAAYAAAALLALVAAGVHRYQARQAERHRAEAQQQFARAMVLTGHALDRVAVQLQRTPLGQIASISQGER